MKTNSHIMTKIINESDSHINAKNKESHIIAKSHKLEKSHMNEYMYHPVTRKCHITIKMSYNCKNVI